MPREVKALKWLVVDLLAAHVDELIEVAGEALRALPPDTRHALLAVARRKGCLDDAALGALMDETATVLDVSGCGDAVTDTGVRALVARGALRSIVAADITSCRGITTDGIRELVSGAPNLEVLRCGGDLACNAACRAAIAPTHPEDGVLPRLVDSRRRSLESWEALAPSYGDDGTVSEKPDSDGVAVAAFGEGARALRWLVWPDVDRVSRGRVAQRCPRARVIAPSPEAVDAANEAARDVHFVAVAGEGWIGWGEKSAAADPRGREDDARLKPRETRSLSRSSVTGRSENNDGFVLVSASGDDAGSPRANDDRVDPWWYRRRDGDFDRPPAEADPTRALDLRAVRLVRRDVYGGDATGAGPRSFVSRESASAPKFHCAAGAPAGVARGALRWRLNFAEDAEGAESVAARFARACREVESARVARREKNLRKQRNRQRNKLGSAERHIWNAMNDMALVDGNEYR